MEACDRRFAVFLNMQKKQSDSINTYISTTAKITL